MTMKHPRENEAILLGSDHSKKRQRTSSVGSESSAIENAVPNTKLALNQNQNHNESTTTSATHSPRMMALLSSLEALEDSEPRQIKHQWPLATVTRKNANAPPAMPLAAAAASTTQSAAALLRQKQRMVQPLTARPTIHKIEEHPPKLQASSSQASLSANIAKSTTQAESRDTQPSHSQAVDTTAMNTIQRAVAVSAAASNYERTKAAAASSTYSTAVNAALGASSAYGGISHTRTPALASSRFLAAPRLAALQSFSFSNPNTATTALAQLSHQSRSLNFQGPTARQMAIHNAVHSDYKKIYKPLKRPPRLPSPHEALVIAAISTATPSACR